jgi:hypothetical protein
VELAAIPTDTAGETVTCTVKKPVHVPEFAVTVYTEVEVGETTMLGELDPPGLQV